MTKKQIIDIDAEFEGVEFDEVSINRATAYKKRSDNPEWHKNRNEALKDALGKPEVKEKFKKIAKNRDSSHYNNSMTDPSRKEEMRLKRIEGIKKSKENNPNIFSEAQKKRYEDPLERKKTGQASKLASKNPEVKKRRQVASKKLWEDADRRKRASQSHKKQWDDPDKRKKLSDTMKALRRKPMVTPDGIFEDQEKVAIFYGLTEATIAYRRRKYPKEYYYISKQEYTKLTGKDII